MIEEIVLLIENRVLVGIFRLGVVGTSTVASSGTKRSESLTNYPHCLGLAVKDLLEFPQYRIKT